ncbi:MAG: SDR family oxidoreductase [Nanoarchaeota archaeon]|nr:SDR family oxidoreductase [Nanoarchaeota archaeon]
MSNSDLFSLKGKVALVTGAARGNGYAIANGLIDAGAIVYYVDINPIEINRANAFVIQVDITKEENLERIFNEIMNAHSRIDILVNNAGRGKGAPAENYTLEEWDQTIGINLTAPFRLSQIAAKYMINNGAGGNIINITSLGAELGFPDNPAYLASKGGLKMMAKGFANDWAQYGIRVNNVCPGYIHTPLHEGRDRIPELSNPKLNRMMIKRWGEPEDLVGAVIFLASNASNYVTGEDIHVDGGWAAKGL